MTKDCKVRRIQKLCFNAALTAFLASVGLFLFASDKAYAAGTTYSITYYENTVTNMPENESGLGTSTDTTTLSSTKPSRSGFKFNGWCNTATIKDANGNDTCSGTTYLAGANNYPINNGISFNTKLYAIWTEEKTIANSTTMQEVTSCPASLPTGQVYTLNDSRDNTEYHTAKLADGKCWLLDNLALDLTNSTVLSGMNENNTHASNTTLGYLKGTTTGTTSNQYATAKVSNWTSSYSYSAPLVNMTNKDVVPTDATSQAGQYKVGGYYNYCAASAGSYCYGNGTSAGTSSGNATEDICPKGWRMPTGDSGEYQTLYSNTNYNTYDKYREALRLPLSGYFNDGSATRQGSYGYWWSSTRSSNSFMYYLYAETSGIYPANANYRYRGFSVRCVLGS